jgi:hypothetical protein
MTPTKEHKAIVNDIIAFASDFPREIVDEVISDYIQMLKDADGLSNLDVDVIISMLWARGY